MNPLIDLLPPVDTVSEETLLQLLDLYQAEPTLTDAQLGARARLFMPLLRTLAQRIAHTIVSRAVESGNLPGLREAVENAAAEAKKR